MTKAPWWCRFGIYPDYLDGEALAFFKYLNSSHRFSSYDEMCETLTTEFEKLETQIRAYGNKKQLDSLQWDRQMSIREFAETLQSQVRAVLLKVGILVYLSYFFVYILSPYFRCYLHREKI